MNEAGRIKSEKLRKQQYKEDYARSLDSQRVVWDEAAVERKRLHGRMCWEQRIKLRFIKIYEEEK